MRGRPPTGHFPARDRTLCTRTPTPMEPAAILTFLLICGFIWGGFTLILAKAIRKERGKEGME